MFVCVFVCVCVCVCVCVSIPVRNLSFDTGGHRQAVVNRLTTGRHDRIRGAGDKGERVRGLIRGWMRLRLFSSSCGRKVVGV